MKRHRNDDRLDWPPTAHLRPDYKHNEPISDETRSYVTDSEVIELLQDIECHREALAHDISILQRWLTGSAELQVEWSKFIRNGGVTAADFAAFMDGQFRYRRIRQSKHLRLVNSVAATNLKISHSTLKGS
jgi:hypothetical protein